MYESRRQTSPQANASFPVEQINRQGSGKRLMATFIRNRQVRGGKLVTGRLTSISHIASYTSFAHILRPRAQTLPCATDTMASHCLIVREMSNNVIKWLEPSEFPPFFVQHTHPSANKLISKYMERGQRLSCIWS